MTNPKAPASFAASVLTASLLAGCAGSERTARSDDYRPPARDAGADAPAAPAASADVTDLDQGIPPPGPASTGELLEAPSGMLLPIQKRFIHDTGIPVAVLREGTGERASFGGTVTVHTKGTFTNTGGHFYSTLDDGPDAPPMTWDLDQLIRGWQLVVPEMRVGDIWVIQIPWDLAYGEDGRKDDATGEEVIPPRADLTFAIELFDVGPSTVPPRR